MIKTSTGCETICLTSLAYGDFEYFEVDCLEDIEEAYRDFDKRIAHDTDIELQYIDGCLTGYSTYHIENIFELVEEFDADIQEVRDSFNATTSIEETRDVLDEKNYFYIEGHSKLNAFIEYVEEYLNYFDDMDDRFKYYIDYEKLMRDFEIEDLRIEEINYTTYLFIY